VPNVLILAIGATPPIAGDTFPVHQSNPVPPQPIVPPTPAAVPEWAAPVTSAGQPGTGETIVVQPRFIFGRQGSRFTCHFCQHQVHFRENFPILNIIFRAFRKLHTRLVWEHG